MGMARQGDVIENPVTGERIEFRRTATDTDGEVLEFEYVVRPGGFVVASHLHPRQEERMEVQDGSLNVSIDGDEWVATKGTKFAVPPGVIHDVWNDGDEAVRVLVEIRPALRMERFFETLFGLARDGKTNRKGRPNPLQFAVLADVFDEEIRIGGVPIRLQRVLLPPLAAVGRRFGYRGMYWKYSQPPKQRKRRFRQRQKK